MLFRKRRVPPALFAKDHSPVDNPMPEWEIITVEFDMMTKGVILHRRRRKIRQFAVMVNGSVRVVTSGDTVDRETFMALLAADAVRAPWMHPAPSGALDETPEQETPASFAEHRPLPDRTENQG